MVISLSDLELSECVLLFDDVVVVEGVLMNQVLNSKVDGKLLLYNINDLKQIKAELADLLEEDAKADKLRRLPLYSCKITGWKFVCSKCYEKI